MWRVLFRQVGFGKVGRVLLGWGLFWQVWLGTSGYVEASSGGVSYGVAGKAGRAS